MHARRIPYCTALFLCSLLALSTATTRAQQGDRPGHVMSEVWHDMEVPEAPPLSPQEGLASLMVAPGFRVELVAAEPLVEDPITLDWDRHGRLWVVEMRGFMPNVDGDGEQEPVGRVVVLQDHDHDGVMDESTVFLDGLVMPRALMVTADGVLIGEPPHLWLCRDSDDDLVCDDKTEIGRYGDPDPEKVEHTENGLLWALDNWIYNAKSDRRFRYRNGVLSEQETHFRGQWGISQDDLGRLYYNTNSRYLFGDLLSDDNWRRNPNLPAQGSGPGINDTVVRSEATYSVRVNPGINRGYQSEMLLADGRLAKTTSVSGVAIYRGHQFPESYVGDAFVPEPAGNLVALFDLWEDDLGLQARQVTSANDRWGRQAFLASTDERFRPVDAAVGPDGALYVVDMYRGILQHKTYVTTFLRKQILERGLDRPLGLGRIYRVVYEGRPFDPTPPDLVSDGALLAGLAHPNGWVRDTAQQLLVETATPDEVAALRRMVLAGPEVASVAAPPSARVAGLARAHALWTLHGIGVPLDVRLLAAALDDSAATVREAGLRWITALPGSLDASLPESQLGQLGAAIERCLDDHEPRVQLHALLALGKLGDAGRRTLVALLPGLLDDELRRQAIFSGIRGAEAVAFALLVAARNELPRGTAGFDDTLALLAAGSARSGNAAEFGATLELAEPLQPATRARIAEAVLEAAGEENVTLPRLERVPGWLLAASGDEPAARLARTFANAGGPPVAADVEAVPAALLQQGQRLYRSVCSSCHGDDGQGREGLGPSLAGATRRSGPAESMVRIVLQGLQGPLTSQGESWDDIMPGFAADRRMNDAGVAALLTYLRNAWGRTGAVVDTSTVGSIRSRVAARSTAWSVAELDALHEPGLP